MSVDPKQMIERLGQELSEDLYIQEVLNAVDYCFNLVQGQQEAHPSEDEEDLIQIYAASGDDEMVSYGQRQQVVLLPSTEVNERSRRSVSSNGRPRSSGGGGQQIYVSEEGGPMVMPYYQDGVVSPDYSDDRYELSLSGMQ